MTILSWIVDPGKTALSKARVFAADADGSAFVDVFDAVEILTYIVSGGWGE